MRDKHSGWKTIVWVALLGIVASGCVTSRHIVKAADHPTAPLTLMESKDVIFFILPQYQYWECKDEGKALTCYKACGTGLDTLCPAEPMSISGGR